MNARLFMAAVLALPLAVASCKKDDDNKPSPKEETCVPVKIKSGATAESAVTTSEIIYDGNRQTRIDRFHAPSGSPSGHWAFTYDASGRLTESALYDSVNNRMQLDLYSYDAGNRVVRIARRYNDPSVFGPYRTFEYNSENQRVRENAFYNSDSTLSAYSLFTYTNGDMTKLEYFVLQGPSAPRLTYTLERTYDNMKTHNFNVEPKIWPSAHNVKTFIFKGPDGIIDESNSFRYDYEYNAKGFPVKSTGAALNNDPAKSSVYWFEYSCR